MPLKGVALIRVSTAGQAEESKGGIPAQREAIRRIAELHNIHITPECYFELTDVSGASVLRSADYQRFLHAVEDPEITAVVTKEFTRLMRPERFDDYAILQHFVDHGITLYMPDAVMNLANRQDRFFAGLKAGMAGMERHDIRQRMMDGKEALRRRGHHPSGAFTLARGIGFTKDKGWFYKEDELGPVRLIFEAFLNGEHNYARLSALGGIPRSSIRILLTNPVYAGVMTYRTRHDLSPSGAYTRKDGHRGYRRKVERSAAERIEFVLPLEPIVTMEQHRYIVDLVENVRVPRAQVRQSALPRFTYRGFLRCGSCKNLIYTWVGGRLLSGQPKDFYHCKSGSPRERAKRLASGIESSCSNRHMSRAKLEDVLDRALVERLSAPKFLTAIIAGHVDRARRQSESDHAGVINAELDRLESKRKRIIDAFVDGNIDRVSKQFRLSEIDNQVDELRIRLRSLKPVNISEDQVLGIVRVFDRWLMRTQEQKRRILELLVPRIYVSRYIVQGIDLRIPSGSSDSRLTANVYVTTPSPYSESTIYIPFSEEVRV